jgi:hypothetical protein
VASSAPQRPGSELDDLLSRSPEGAHITSCDKDGSGKNLVGDERGSESPNTTFVCLWGWPMDRKVFLGWKPIAL